MKDYASITTPDHVELEFELVGPGIRGVAVIIDTLIIGLIILAIVFAFVLGGLAEFSLTGGTQTFLFALIFILIFLLKWGYFLAFETWMIGQTPGKRMMKIRVVKDNGLPITFREALIRNLLRVADMLPPTTYLTGILVASLNERGKRLGDMAAGTIVVIDRQSLANDPHLDHTWGANWVARLERGEGRHLLTLSTGKISVRQIDIFDRFLNRFESLPEQQQKQLARKLVVQHLPHFDFDPDRVDEEVNPTRTYVSVMRKILAMAQEDHGDDSSEKARGGKAKNLLWQSFAKRVDQILGRGKLELQRLNAKDLKQLIRDYRRVVADLARAKAMGSDPKTLGFLNRMATAGHNVLYQHHADAYDSETRISWPGFARQVRANLGAVALAAALFFGPAIISYTVVQLHPEMGYDLVSGGFVDFQPASDENLHEIPSLARPMFASQIMTNNLQVTLLAFGLGLSFGIGTVLILMYNGIFLGAVAGWMTLMGKEKALWGWIMPHGGTELMAIVLAGAAGLILARAMIAPGRLPRSLALKKVALNALTIELGCMFMLVIAGLIEGFISPSGISFPIRILILLTSLTAWTSWLALAGHPPNQAPPKR